MTRDNLLTFIRAHRWAVVSTVSASGEPQGAVVRFVVTDAFELLFDTTDTTHKAGNLRHNRKVAVVIGWDDNQTIQIEGLADEPAGQELQRLKQTYTSGLRLADQILLSKSASHFWRLAEVEQWERQRVRTAS